MAVTIAPSILAADFAAFGAECRAVCEAGADWIHVDVMDGHFVPNLTFGPPMVAALRPHVTGTLDVHLMVTPPDAIVAQVAAAGADVITVHAEAGPHIHRSLQAIRALGKKAGLAINPGTGLDAMSSLIDMVDLVCVMTVNPGFGGQVLIESQLAKIAALRGMIGARPIRLQADGGINRQTVARVAAAGADVLVAGSAVFSGGPSQYAHNLRGLRDAVHV